jgi:hypothetical protein
VLLLFPLFLFLALAAFRRNPLTLSLMTATGNALAAIAGVSLAAPAFLTRARLQAVVAFRIDADQRTVARMVVVAEVAEIPVRFRGPNRGS